MMFRKWPFSNGGGIKGNDEKVFGVLPQYPPGCLKCVTATFELPSRSEFMILSAYSKLRNCCISRDIYYP